MPHFWHAILKKIKFNHSCSCCAEGKKNTCAVSKGSSGERRKIVVVGSPNVGKSLLFSRLTGTYVTVSNYPGTTVEVSRGKVRIGEEEFELIDTPGMYSFLPLSEEERVTRTLLRQEKPDVVMHIVDAKNIERMLVLTLQLIEAKLPVILVLNIMDEAQNLGMRFNLPYLEKELKVPVVATTSTTGRGIDILKGRVEEYVGDQKRFRGDSGGLP